MNAQRFGLASWVTGSRSSAARLTPKLITDLNPAAPIGDIPENRPKTRPTAAAAAAVTRSMRTGICLLAGVWDTGRTWRSRSRRVRQARVRRLSGQFLGLRARTRPIARVDPTPAARAVVRREPLGPWLRSDRGVGVMPLRVRESQARGHKA